MPRAPVPNAPCGVERSYPLRYTLHPPQVPNAPCGVESSYTESKSASLKAVFLMHRVELKVMGFFGFFATLLGDWFLMHRVELKV